jgi:hypothetical protein
MSDEWIMIWKGFGRKRSSHNLDYYPGICMVRLRNTTRKLSRQRFEPSTSRIRVKKANRYVNLFGPEIKISAHCPMIFPFHLLFYYYSYLSLGSEGQQGTICLTPSSRSDFAASRVRVTLRLTVSQSVCLGVEPRLGLMTRYLFTLKVTVLSIWGALSDERSGLSFVGHSR